MKLTFAPKGIVQIDDARIIYRNFEGRGDRYNREGDRSFAVVIPTQELADALINDVNKYGAGWNVKIKPPREEGDEPFMYLQVKVKFNGRGPHVYLVTGTRTNKLDENTISRLDRIDIEHVDLDIRPYDDEIQGKPFRAAYLYSIRVVQNIDRFGAELAESEYPEE